MKAFYLRLMVLDEDAGDVARSFFTCAFACSFLLDDDVSFLLDDDVGAVRPNLYKAFPATVTCGKPSSLCRFKQRRGERVPAEREHRRSCLTWAVASQSSGNTREFNMSLRQSVGEQKRRSSVR